MKHQKHQHKYGFSQNKHHSISKSHYGIERHPLILQNNKLNSHFTTLPAQFHITIENIIL